MACCDGDDELKAARGLDRAPTSQEAAGPPDKRPWTEYDANGDKQEKPPFKACQPSLCLLWGPTCCVFELQWCQSCGGDADDTCDILCRCQTNRLKLCICCGPQRDDPLCDCCAKSIAADAKVTLNEACECDCITNNCSFRYAGCQFCCFHVSCVKVPPCCPNCEPCCCCEEEALYMDGDLKPLRMQRI